MKCPPGMSKPPEIFVSDSPSLYTWCTIVPIFNPQVSRESLVILESYMYVVVPASSARIISSMLLRRSRLIILCVIE